MTQARAGLKVAYNAGQRVSLPAHKAEMAVRNKWAVYADAKPAAKTPEPPAAKVVPPTLDTAEAVLSHFKGDKKAMRDYAEEQGIYIHFATKKAETIAEKIAEANS